MYVSSPSRDAMSGAIISWTTRYHMPKIAPANHSFTIADSVLFEYSTSFFFMIALIIHVCVKTALKLR